LLRSEQSIIAALRHACRLRKPADGQTLETLEGGEPGRLRALRSPPAQTERSG
jgi:hypothetical protein